MIMLVFQALNTTETTMMKTRPFLALNTMKKTQDHSLHWSFLRCGDVSVRLKIVVEEEECLFPSM
jgi:hypothetical protein